MPMPEGLHRPGSEHDACGVGFVADLRGRPGTHILPLALTALARMEHRGALGADGATGDGAGVTTGIPHDLLAPELARLGAPGAAAGDVAVGMAFLPRGEGERAAAIEVVAAAVRAEGVPVLGWRDLPVREEALGDIARRSRPFLAQMLGLRPAGATDDDFERALYRARRTVEASGVPGLYLASLSHRTLVYKALVRSSDLGDVFPDLRHPGYRTAFALFHNRFSTNTEPSWPLTQPFRMLAHNGEINTIQGNRAWMAARGPRLLAPALGLGPGRPQAVLTGGASDSASLDDALALLTHAGRGVAHAMTLLVPPAWEGDALMPPSVRALFDYQSCVLEPWDGPALVAFTDGRVVGAALDRNGLRPARYATTLDGLLMVASEAGVLDVDERRILHRGRLGPGDVLAVDMAAERVLDREAVHARLAERLPHAHWLSQRRLSFDPGPPEGGGPAATATLRAFGVTREEMQLVLGPMHRDGLEPLGSMGDDTALPVLSARPQLLSAYFRQRFAQVTNPPIDPLRESLVMSLAVHLGPKGDLLQDGPAHADQVHLPGPYLHEGALRALVALERTGWRACTVGVLFAAEGGPVAFAAALDALLDEAARAVEGGTTLLVLSDRGVDERHAALPMLLAVSAVHQHLIRLGLRTCVSLVADTGEARDEHQLALLLSFGASAVCPWLALDAIAGAVDGADAAREARTRYLAAVTRGLLKVMSKMGISTLRSYHGAQLGEALGIAEDLIDRHFTGTPSLVGGLGLREIAAETLARHATAFAPHDGLDEGGVHRYRQGGELRAYAPRVVKTLHDAIRTGAPLTYRAYADMLHGRGPIALRDLLELREAAPVPLDEVEPVEAIVPRFVAAAMSLGALSPEAHAVMATAMNRLGGRSNCGEGGEDGAAHRVKQVASARFGVTAAYLVSADELQIKIAQGSKPGEGGQLPGHKVTEHIARVRRAAPGVTLISPPPHHDIYSIEDLAQLVHDLKRVNPRAQVSVKLVSQAGIGTVAAGVAKADADAIVIGGHDGGTGASPLASIRNAGTPWELGLAEAQQVLVQGGLRARVRLQVEGGLRTGRDVVMAALLGADEYGFGSVALVAAGCVMARQCHLDTCPAGIATQREALRRKFRGTPEDVVRFFTAVAQEVREILALLGERRLADVIGRTELLAVRLPASGKASTLRLDRLLAGAAMGDRPRRYDPSQAAPRGWGRLDRAVLTRLPFAVAKGAPLTLEQEITNEDRAVGAGIAGHLAAGRSPGRVPVAVTYRGSAGQSFGAFCVDGLRLVLEGEANDGVAKGMSGGSVVIRPRRSSLAGDVVAGNAVLYGATGGALFVAGRAGERFAVRNSGARAVVEGVGDHACEYMTAGAVIILGPVGRNLGAGMSGGSAYVLDPDLRLARLHNPAMVAIGPVPAEEQDWLREGLERHAAETGSDRARALLASWAGVLPLFRKMAPPRAADALPAWTSAPLSPTRWAWMRRYSGKR